MIGILNRISPRTWMATWKFSDQISDQMYWHSHHIVGGAYPHIYNKHSRWFRFIIAIATQTHTHVCSIRQWNEQRPRKNVLETLRHTQNIVVFFSAETIHLQSQKKYIKKKTLHFYESAEKQSWNKKKKTMLLIVHAPRHEDLCECGNAFVAWYHCLAFAVFLPASFRNGTDEKNILNTNERGRDNASLRLRLYQALTETFLRRAELSLHIDRDYHVIWMHRTIPVIGHIKWHAHVSHFHESGSCYHNEGIPCFLTRLLVPTITVKVSGFACNDDQLKSPCRWM